MRSSQWAEFGGKSKGEQKVGTRREAVALFVDPAFGLRLMTLRAGPVAADNGDLSITCLMGSISLWGEGRVNDARSNGRTRVQLTIKIWRTLPSEAQSVCPAAGRNLSGGAAEQQPQWPRVFRLDLPECS